MEQRSCFIVVNVENLSLSFTRPWINPRILVGSVLLIFFPLTLVPCCDVRYDFHIKTMFGSSLCPVVCRRVHILFTLFVRMPIVGYNTYCVVFVVFLWVLSSSLLPVSLYCRFWIAPSVFSNVYLSMYLYIFCRMFDVHHNCRIKPCSYRFCST